MGNMKAICVFGSSSEKLQQCHYETAEALGAHMAQKGIGLVFGGGGIGLMGACARGAEKHGGRITGVIPEKLHQPGIAYPDCTELVVTKTMHERKKLMEDRADAFIALPGGFGTLEELLEVITLKQLGYHEKPIILLNINAFYDAMLEQFEEVYAAGFANIAYKALYSVAYTAEEALMQALTYAPPALPDKMKEALKEELRA